MAARRQRATRFLGIAALSAAVVAGTGCSTGSATSTAKSASSVAPSTAAQPAATQAVSADAPATSESRPGPADKGGPAAYGSDGLYYVSGTVEHPGPYALSGRRKVTLKQALIASVPPTPLPPDGKVDLLRPGVAKKDGTFETFALADVMSAAVGDRALQAGEIVVLRPR